MRKLATFIAALTLSSQASAITYFSEDFENGMSRWTGTNNLGHNGITVADPLESDSALTFTNTNAAGDIFTSSDTFSAGTYILSFDYLGTCNDNDCGGFIGISSGLPSGHTWLGGTSPLYPDLLPDTGAWEQVSIQFTTSYSNFHLMLEDWGGSGAGAGDAYFDNILLTDLDGPTPTPAPATLALFGLGLLGLRATRRKNRS